MIKRLVALGVIVAATVLTSGGAHACYGDPDSGTLPGPPQTYTIMVPFTNLVFYIDDREYTDLDDDGYFGGTWIYMETNGVTGLQRGGEQFLLKGLPPLPYINPIQTGPIGLPETQVLPPNSVFPEGLVLFPGGVPIHPGVTIFPSGFGGGSVAQALGESDPCIESANPDRLIL